VPACRLLGKSIKVVTVAELLTSESSGSPSAVQIFRRNMPCPHDMGMPGFLTVLSVKLMDK
jgi:hypothetical protein